MTPNSSILTTEVVNYSTAVACNVFADDIDSDGVWGRYWYDSVWRSTGFAPLRERAKP